MRPAHTESRGSRPDWSRINQWLLWIGLAAAVAWMWLRHNEHFIQLLPWLILLACPLMHLFGHGGHGLHHEDGAAAPDRGQPEQAAGNADRTGAPRVHTGQGS